jgi:hypothetical protein
MKLVFPTGGLLKEPDGPGLCSAGRKKYGGLGGSLEPP